MYWSKITGDLKSLFDEENKESVLNKEDKKIVLNKKHKNIFLNKMLFKKLFKNEIYFLENKQLLKPNSVINFGIDAFKTYTNKKELVDKTFNYKNNVGSSNINNNNNNNINADNDKICLEFSSNLQHKQKSHNFNYSIFFNFIEDSTKENIQFSCNGVKLIEILNKLTQDCSNKIKIFPMLWRAGCELKIKVKINTNNDLKRIDEFKKELLENLNVESLLKTLGLQPKTKIFGFETNGQLSKQLQKIDEIRKLTLDLKKIAPSKGLLMCLMTLDEKIIYSKITLRLKETIEKNFDENLRPLVVKIIYEKFSYNFFDYCCINKTLEERNKWGADLLKIFPAHSRLTDLEAAIGPLSSSNNYLIKLLLSFESDEWRESALKHYQGLCFKELFETQVSTNNWEQESTYTRIIAVLKCFESKNRLRILKKFFIDDQPILQEQIILCKKQQENNQLFSKFENFTGDLSLVLPNEDQKWFQMYVFKIWLEVYHNRSIQSVCSTGPNNTKLYTDSFYTFKFSGGLNKNTQTPDIVYGNSNGK